MFALCFVAISLSGTFGLESVFPDAVKLALASSFNRSASLVHIAIQTDSDENKLIFLDMLEVVLAEKWNFKIQLDVNPEGTQTKGGDQNIWLIDSYSAFRLMLPLIRTHQGDSPAYFFIIFKYPRNRKLLKFMKKIFSEMFQRMVANINIIVESTPDEVLFYTFFPYQETICRGTVPTVVNRLKNMTITNSNLFPPKVDNFYGCPIRIAARNQSSLMEVIYLNETVEIRGLEGEILKELAERMNFTFEFHRLKENNDWNSFVFSNGTGTGPYKMLDKGQLDMMVGFYYREPLQDRSFTTSTSHSITVVVLALWHPQQISSTLSWMIKPLGRRSWICTLTLLFITFICVTFVTKNARFSKFFRLQPNRSSIINLFEITLGMSIKFLPRTNFLRLNFILWSLGILILRTAYQGKMFDSYRRMNDTNMPRTIAEILSQNHVIYSRPQYARTIYQINGLKTFNYRNITDLRVILNPIEKNALVASLAHITAILTPKQLENIVLKKVHNQLICLIFQKHSILAPGVNKIIQFLETGGILKFWRKRYNLIPKKRCQENNTHNPITLYRFKYIFISLVSMYLVICMIFVVEVLWHRLRKT